VTKSVARGSLDSPNAILPLSGVEMVILVSKGDWHLGRTGEPSDLSRAEWLQWTNGLWRFEADVDWPNLEWDFVPARGDVRGHPAPMASEMARRLIKMLSFPDAIVYDPFCGSGTTPGEAVKLGRVAWGSDIEAAWVGVSERYVAECAAQL
jgi:site-specific DNA-methyltransferase (adenine-specific)